MSQSLWSHGQNCALFGLEGRARYLPLVNILINLCPLRVQKGAVWPQPFYVLRLFFGPTTLTPGFGSVVIRGHGMKGPDDDDDNPPGIQIWAPERSRSRQPPISRKPAAAIAGLPQGATIIPNPFPDEPQALKSLSSITRGFQEAFQAAALMIFSEKSVKGVPQTTSTHGQYRAPFGSPELRRTLTSGFPSALPSVHLSIHPSVPPHFVRADGGPSTA